MSNSVLASVDEALDAYRQGKMVIVVDDEDRENEGDLVLAADFATPEAINFMVTHARGLVCLAMHSTLLDRLKIPMMVPQLQNRSGFGTGFTISVEAISGVSTGISAEDRSHTIRTLIDPNTTPADIAMPGHIFPLRARDGGVLERRGQTEASVDISVLAGLTPAGIICEVMREDGTMMRLAELSEFGKTHGLHIISVEQLANYRLEHGQKDKASPVMTPDSSASEPLVSETGRSTLPTEHGEFDIVVFRDQQGLEHSALVKGATSTSTPLVRVHSECLTGDAFGSLRCDCGQQLKAAMQQIQESGCGVIVYLRQEGRGIGLGNKMKAYALQEKGLDTVDANHELGFPADARTYDVGAAILKELGIETIRLLSNNPAKREALESLGVEITERIPLVVIPHTHNADYLQTKAEKMGHNYHPDST